MQPFKALFVDPEKGSVTPIEFDGDERTAMNLIGCEQLDRETYPSFEVFRCATTVDKSSVHGFVMERTGGTVHHGKCLIAPRWHNTDFDVSRLKFKYRYVPGFGVKDWK